MVELIQEALAVILTAKVFASHLRRDAGLAPEAVGIMRSHFNVDAGYLSLLLICSWAVWVVGAATAVPLGLLLRAGTLIGGRVLLAPNHAFLEVYCLLVLLRLQHSGAAALSALQVLVVGVWILSACQKLYHGRFVNGAFFLVALQDDGIDRRWLRMRGLVTRLEGYFGPLDRRSLLRCRALAWLTIAVETSVPAFALWLSGTIAAPVLMLILACGVAVTTRETSFLVTNAVLCLVFLVPFSVSSLWDALQDRVTGMVLLCALGWPPFHALLTRALSVSTWKLGGWGMYATIEPRVQLLGPRGDLSAPPMTGFTPFGVMQVCGRCRIRMVRRFALRTFNRWYPASTSVRAFVFWQIDIKGHTYVSRCDSLANDASAELRTHVVAGPADLGSFRQHLLALAQAAELTCLAIFGPVEI